MYKKTLCILLLAELMIFPLVQPSTAQLPPEDEEKTVVVAGSIVLDNIQGEISRQAEDGSLEPLERGAIVKPGDRILVRMGASFTTGKITIRPNSHGDCWVRFRKCAQSEAKGKDQK